LLKWHIRNGEPNKNYGAWRLYRKGASDGEYIGRNEFLKVKHTAEKHIRRANLVEGLNYDALTKDKFVCGSYLSANGIPCVPNHGFILQGSYRHINGEKETLVSLLEKEQELFIKNVSLEASDGVYHCKATDGTMYLNAMPVDNGDLLNEFTTGIWIVQSRIRSHRLIEAINDSALNTTRIVTILNDGQPEYLTGFQAFATGQATTDAWSKGSVYVGFDIQNACLGEQGYLDLSGSPESVITAHPDSGIIFKGYFLPYLQEAIDLCLKAHRLFYNNFVIGWDIAITDSGPVIVEANEKPGMNAVQCVDGGLRKKILECYNSVKSGLED